MTSAQFSIWASAGLGKWDGIALLLKNYACPSPEDLIDLSRKHPSDERLHDCCLRVVAASDNLFISGMTLSVARVDVTKKAPEGERGTLEAIQGHVHALLLEILERLPQTVNGFNGGMADCSAVLGPEFDSKTGESTGFKPPLALLLLANSIQTETFCSTPLIMDYLSRKFTHGLPDVGDKDGVLRNGTEHDVLSGSGPGMMSLVIGGGDDEELDERGYHEFRHKDLLVKNGLKASFESPRALLQGANDRLASLTFLPGAQFAIAGFLAKPNNYYRIPAVRMVLDVVVYLLVIIALSILVFRDSGSLTRGEGIAAAVIFAMTAQLVRFGIVMLVVMVGFAMSLHVLIRDSKSFGETFVALFKATLGDVDYFTASSVLNLLVAILTVSHSKVQENVQREFKVSKARMIQRCRWTVENDWLPAPFNVAQLLFSGQYALVMPSFRRKRYDEAKQAIGQAVSWFVLGLMAFVGGSILWILSVVYALFVWHEHYYVGLDTHTAHVIILQTEPGSNDTAVYPYPCVVRLGCSVVSFPARGQDASTRASSGGDGMLKSADQGVGMAKLREFLADPMNNRDVRKAGTTRSTTVEHLKLLRDRLVKDIVGRLCRLLRKGKAWPKHLIEAFDQRLQQLEAKVAETNDYLIEILKFVKNPR
ncbi:unnamed protein product [Ectocarpus sp. CCAP 1310/34]|nr:unnamed protein product [Ectocarpus sp. CCAP 1310/34]